MNNILQERLLLVRERIAVQCAASGRDPQSVELLAVSKTFPLSAVLEAYQAGQTRFGENYIQEGVEKILACRALAVCSDIEWHCIGPIQSNKTRLVAEHFAWVHSVDRLKIAQRLSEQRPAGMPPLPIPPIFCIIFIMPEPFIFFIMVCICSNSFSMRLTS
jgi:pyridoxal phosphate enzyme (YggS family)